MSEAYQFTICKSTRCFSIVSTAPDINEAKKKLLNSIGHNTEYFFQEPEIVFNPMVGHLYKYSIVFNDIKGE